MRGGRAGPALALALTLLGCAPRQVRTKGLEPARSTAEALSETLAPRRVAITIGVDRYEDPAFPDLKHAGDDADALAQVFESARGGGFDSVVRLTGAPTRDRILERLAQLQQGLRRNDVVVVYFSGHGTRVPDGEGWRRFLLGSDSLPSDLERTAIDLTELQRWFAALPSQRKALIVDACFNGDGKSVVRPENRRPTHEPTLAASQALSPGEARLFATTPGRPSVEDDGLGHGVYTYYLLEALGWGFAEADRDGDRVITVWEAHDHARERTYQRTGGVQVPEAALRIVGTADLVLAGEPDARQRRERSLVYLYPRSDHDFAGALLEIDGRTRGALPGTMVVSPGRHHLAVKTPEGDVLAEGYAQLGTGRAYRLDDLAQELKGPRTGVAMRPVWIASPPLQRAIGAGAVGLEAALWRRDDTAPGRNQFASVHLGFATSPTRPDFQTARTLVWAGLEGGFQTDWRRVRGRAGWSLTGVWLPTAFPNGRPEDADPTERLGEAGWIFPATGPVLGASWVLSELWSVGLHARPQVSLLDPDFDGRVDVVPWLNGGLTIEAAL